VRASMRSYGSVARLLVIAVLAIAAAAAAGDPDPVVAEGSGYASAVMTDAPRAYWRLGETSGLTAVSQTGVHPGTYQGGVLLGQPGALFPDPDGSASLDGTDDSVRVQHSDQLAPASAFSLEVWTKPTSLPSGSAVISLMRKDAQYQLAVTAGGKVRLRLWQAGAIKEAITPAGAVKAGSWSYVTATWNGTTMAIWVDGAKRAEADATGMLDGGGSSLYLGASWGTSDRLAGQLDEAAIYPAALSAERIAAHRDAANVPPPDAAPPTVTLTKPAGGAAVTDTTPTFSGAAGTADGDAASVTVELFSGATTGGSPLQTLTAPVSGGGWTVDAAPALAYGTYTVRARQTDAAGNVGQTASSTFSVQSPPPTGYAAKVLADDPTAYWRLDDAAGLVATDKRGGSPGAYRGGALLDRPGALAGPDTAITLDGVNDTVRMLDTPALDSANALTVEAWVKPTALPSSSATVVRKDGQFQLRLMANGSLRLRLWKGGDAVEWATAAATISTGSWQHVAFTFDGAVARLYVGGTLRASGAIAAPIAISSAPLTLGSSFESYDWLAGSLDEVAIYGKAVAPERLVARAAAAADETDPTVTLTAPADGSSTLDTTPELAGAAGTAEGDAETVSIEIHSGANASGPPVATLTATRLGPVWSRDAEELAPGTYTVRAEQHDAAGNVGRSEPSTFTIAEPPPPPTYSETVLQDHPRAYWRLGEANGVAAHDEVGANLAFYSGGPLLGRSGALAGKPDTAVGLDGVNDSVEVLDGPGLGSPAGVAVEAWVLPATLPAGTASIARKDGQFLLRLRADGSVVFRLWKAGVSYEASSLPGTVEDGGWTHLVASWDGVEMRLYADATLIASRPLSGLADTTIEGLSLGSSFGAYDFFAGALDEVAVYDAGLSPERVRAHFDAAVAAAVDDRAPLVTLPAPATGSTMDPLPNFGGRAGHQAGDLSTVTVDVHSGADLSGATVRTVTAERSSSGTFSVRLSSPLPDGTYTARAAQADEAGNVGYSAPTTFSVVAGDPIILGAGDIVGCDTTGDEATAELLDRLPGLVTTLGDHVYETGSESDFANCYDPTWGRHKARTLPTIGGHEHLSSPNAAAYYGYFGAAAGDPTKGYYSYDLGTWHVVSLNTECTRVGGCVPGSPEEQWLRADLLAHPAECTIALMHEPRFSSGGVHGPSYNSKYLFMALEDAGADVVLSGDDHLYERFAPQTTLGVPDPAHGVRQFVVGTGGRSHYEFGLILANSEVRANEAFGVLKMTLHPGSYGWKFEPVAGKTFTDTGSTNCH
jgi:Concanavalin A-like lectin/glucanases superfamily/Bacterial Ig-like domain